MTFDDMSKASPAVPFLKEDHTAVRGPSGRHEIFFAEFDAGFDQVGDVFRLDGHVDLPDLSGDRRLEFFDLGDAFYGPCPTIA